MRFIKLGVISIIVFFLLLTAITLLLPSQINISRAININAPVDSVYNSINNVANWKYWYANLDSSNVTASPESVGKGAVFTLGKTKVVITETSLQKVKAEWQTGDHQPLPGEFNIISQDQGSHVTVQWLFVQKVKWYPWQKLALISSDKSVGAFMEKCLDNLKSYNEGSLNQ